MAGFAKVTCDVGADDRGRGSNEDNCLFFRLATGIPRRERNSDSTKETIRFFVVHAVLSSQ